MIRPAKQEEEGLNKKHVLVTEDVKKIPANLHRWVEIELILAICGASHFLSKILLILFFFLSRTCLFTPLLLQTSLAQTWNVSLNILYSLWIWKYASVQKFMILFFLSNKRIRNFLFTSPDQLPPSQSTWLDRKKSQKSPSNRNIITINPVGSQIEKSSWNVPIQ